MNFPPIKKQYRKLKNGTASIQEALFVVNEIGSLIRRITATEIKAYNQVFQKIDNAFIFWNKDYLIKQKLKNGTPTAK